MFNYIKRVVKEMVILDENGGQDVNEEEDDPYLEDIDEHEALAVLPALKKVQDHP